LAGTDFCGKTPALSKPGICIAMKLSFTYALALTATLALPAHAQMGGGPRLPLLTATDENQKPPSAEAISLARTLTEKTGGGRLATMNGMSLPISKVMRQLHVGPAHAEAVMHEALFTVLESHSDDLTSIQVMSYATTLSIDDMKAAIAFYDSPAGKDLVKYHNKMVMVSTAAVMQLFDKLQPEFAARTEEVLKRHGWTHMSAPTDSAPMGAPVK
jgi:hypothetical protein